MKYIKILVIVLSFAFIGLGMVSSANALLITPSTVPQITGSDNSNLSDAQISAIVGSTVSLLYKQDVGFGDEGTFASSYETIFSNSSTDPMDADIIYGSGPYITGSPLYLYVKDGKQDPAFYIFNLNTLGWDGTDILELRDFWPGNGSISHVAIYGPVRVPEPTTLLLLGFGLVGLAGVSRKLKK